MEDRKLEKSVVREDSLYPPCGKGAYHLSLEEISPPHLESLPFPHHKAGDFLLTGTANRYMVRISIVSAS
jgi:hypothetical protein